jgi:hypothetical protein
VIVATNPIGPAGARQPGLGLGASALALGLLGLAFCWLVPVGIILSVAGTMSGLVGWGLARPRPGRAAALAALGAALSVLALVLGLALLPDRFVPWTVRLFQAGSP